MNSAVRDPHQELAKYLNTLPAGYPPTENGLEIQLLQRLFTKEEAALALHLSLINASPSVIARRAGLPPAPVTQMLSEMAQKGLVAVHYEENVAVSYAIHQFVIGFWEGQVNRLDKDTIALFEEYGPTWFKAGPWRKFPQVRTIPINQAISVTTEVMAYESAKEILQSKKLIAVQNCICRQERALMGQGCGKPMETCLSFDGAARSSIATGKAREISYTEALGLLEQANKAGLVLQPANSQNPIFMCACCDCCCGILRQIKLEENPADLVITPFMVSYHPQTCIGCDACIEICPMDALAPADNATVNLTISRCIGCGLCVSRCPTDSLQLIRKSKAEQPRIPQHTSGTYIHLSKERGITNLAANLWQIIKAYVLGVLPRFKSPPKG